MTSMSPNSALTQTSEGGMKYRSDMPYLILSEFLRQGFKKLLTAKHLKNTNLSDV